LLMAGCFVMVAMIDMLKIIALGIILIFELDQFQGIRDGMTLLFALAIGGLALVGILQYDEYNEERITQLEEIVGKDKDNGI